jgi:hypothetical protein
MEQQSGYPTQQQAPAYSHGPQVPMAPVVSMGQWVVSLLLMLVPLVNIILLIVWASSSSENPNRKHWAGAQLIFMAVGTGLYFLMMATFGAAMLGLAGK